MLGEGEGIGIEHRYNWVSGFPCPVLNTFLWDEINLTSFCHLINGDDKNADNPSCSQGSLVVVDCPTQLTSISIIFHLYLSVCFMANPNLANMKKGQLLSGCGSKGKREKCGNWFPFHQTFVLHRQPRWQCYLVLQYHFT